MGVGYPINKGTLDNRAGYLVISLRQTFEGIDTYAQFLAEHDDAYLIDLGYEQEDCDLLRAAIGALAKLARVARAQDTVPAADNFFFHAKKLTALD